MKDSRQHVYHAKILLFGEYSVIKNSMALTIPFSHFHGELRFLFDDTYTNYDFAKHSNKKIYNFLGYVRELEKQHKLNFPFDTDQFADDRKNGLYGESSIPEVYGVGSSGGRMASLYDKYSDFNPLTLDTKQMNELKKNMALLESFYHGTSSGIDPLNALISKPLLFRGNGDVQITDIHLPAKNPDFAVFLINSGKKGKTGPLVNYFMEKTGQHGNGSIDIQHLNSITNQSIESIIAGDNHSFFHNLSSLSAFQLTHLSKMIPDGFRTLWKEGLESESYYLKLCGSGGGGFILGFTNNFPSVRHIMEGKNIDINPVYVNELSEP